MRRGGWHGEWPSGPRRARRRARRGARCGGGGGHATEDGKEARGEGEWLEDGGEGCGEARGGVERGEELEQLRLVCVEVELRVVAARSAQRPRQQEDAVPPEQVQQADGGHEAGAPGAHVVRMCVGRAWRVHGACMGRAWGRHTAGMRRARACM